MHLPSGTWQGVRQGVQSRQAGHAAGSICGRYMQAVRASGTCRRYMQAVHAGFRCSRRYMQAVQAGFRCSRQYTQTYLTTMHLHSDCSTPTCVFTSTCEGSTVMWGWLWYHPTTRVGRPVLLLTCSASALHAAICSGLVSTRSCRCMIIRQCRSSPALLAPFPAAYQNTAVFDCWLLDNCTKASHDVGPTSSVKHMNDTASSSKICPDRSTGIACTSNCCQHVSPCEGAQCCCCCC